MRHLPNILTALRLLSMPVIVWLMVSGRFQTAFWVFAVSSITDAVDGAIARLFDARTRLGQWLDPLADKVMLVGVYLTLGVQSQVPLWLVVLVVLRDVLIVLYALVYVLAGSFDTSPLLISKINTAAQITLAGVVLAHLGQGWGGPRLSEAFQYVVAATTVGSAVAYLMAVGRRGPPAEG